MGHKDEISQEELQAQSGQEVPDREAMSLVNANLALPINAAIAANVLSDGSIAYANAIQQPTIDQSTAPGGTPTV
jgi:secreted protein with Ig-like and vWFA domain